MATPYLWGFSTVSPPKTMSLLSGTHEGSVLRAVASIEKWVVLLQQVRGQGKFKVWGSSAPNNSSCSHTLSSSISYFVCFFCPEMLCLRASSHALGNLFPFLPYDAKKSFLYHFPTLPPKICLCSFYVSLWLDYNIQLLSQTLV